MGGATRFNLRYTSAYRRLMKLVSALLVLLLLTCAQAQEALQSSYAGLQLGGVLSSSGPAPFAELQLGRPAAENVELRAAGLPLILVNVLQLDLLYTWRRSEVLRGYVGGGPDALLLAFTDGPAFGVHATAGLEYRPGGAFGLFAEAQPVYLVSGPYSGLGTFLGKLNLGVNLHF